MRRPIDVVRRRMEAGSRSAAGRMRLRGLALFACGLVVLVGLTLIGIIYALMPGFADVERGEAIEHVARAQQALSVKLTALDSKTGDWANWTDNYNFVLRRNPDFVNEVTETSFTEIGINVIAIVRSSGAVALSMAYDLEQRGWVSFPHNLLDQILKVEPFWARLRPESRLSGIVSLPSGPMLVSARPILTSEGQGPVHGVLIFGRNFDQREVADLSRRLHLPVSIPALPPARWQGLPLQPSLLWVDEAATIDVDRNGTLTGTMVVADIHGRPAFPLRLDLPRHVYARGREAALYFLTTITGLGFVLGLLLLGVSERHWATRRAQQSTEQRYRAIGTQASEGILLVDPATQRVLEVNRACEALLGLHAGELLKRTIAEISPALSDELLRLSETIATEAGGPHQEVHYARPDGAGLIIEVSGGAIVSDGERIAVLVLRNVTARRRAEAELRISEERYAVAARGSNDGLWDWDLTKRSMYCSPRLMVMLGLPEQPLVTNLHGYLERVHREDAPRVAQALQRHIRGDAPHFECEFRMRHEDGAWRWVLARGLAIRDEQGVATRCAGSLTDITERKRIEEQLIHDAFHDTLTGLPNRALFADRLAQVIQRSTRRDDPAYAVFFLDLDRFKIVNDSLGHLAGDDLLEATGRRIAENLRPGDTVARLGGDEFALLLEDVHNDSDAVAVANRIQNVLRTPVDFAARQAVVTGSIGIVLGDRRYTAAGEILRDADTALYRAKALGRNQWVVFDTSMHARAVQLLQLEGDLRQALELHEFAVHYQPIVHLISRRIEGFEALLRWNHPVRGMVPPDEFIPLAVETGLIVPIGLWVAEQALNQVTIWNARHGEAPMWISVNVAARQFSGATLIDDITHVLKATGGDPRTLRLEITESAVMENPEAATATIQALRGLGIKVAMDDFGTGYSSLNALHRFPIDILKIDRSFVGLVADGAEPPAIIGTIVAMAQKLGLELVAEGVETRHQIQQMVNLGCDLAQGFAFSRPVDSHEASRLLDLASAERVTAATD